MELSLNNNKTIETTLEREQNKFINTVLGKVINTGVDIGLRSVLPDLIEDEVISIKDAILENGFKSRFKYSNYICNKFWKKCYWNFDWDYGCMNT